MISSQIKEKNDLKFLWDFVVMYGCRDAMRCVSTVVCIGLFIPLIIRFSAHDLSKMRGIPEWGNEFAKREVFSAPPLFEGRNKKVEGRIKVESRKFFIN